MLMRGLKSVFNFVVEAHRERAERYRDWRHESRRLDRYDTAELIKTMDHNRWIKLGDVMTILDGVRARTEYRFNDNDWDQYVAPVFNQIKHACERTHIECRLDVLEHVLPDGRVRVGDALDILANFTLPAGRPKDPAARQTIAIPTGDTAHDTSKWHGRLLQRLADALPLRTPSSDVQFTDTAEDHQLNIHRPLVIAIGLAAKLRDQTKNIELAEIPTLRETQMERRLQAQKPKEARYYRGQRLD